MKKKKTLKKPLWKDAPTWAKSLAVCDYDDPITNHFKGQYNWMAGIGPDKPGYFINYELRPKK